MATGHGWMLSARPFGRRLSPTDHTRFPPPAHRTGRADLPHPALGPGSFRRLARCPEHAWSVDETESLIQVFRRVSTFPPTPHAMLVHEPATYSALKKTLQLHVRFRKRSVAEVVQPTSYDTVDVADQFFRTLPRHVVANHPSKLPLQSANANLGWISRHIRTSTTTAVLNAKAVSEEVERFGRRVADSRLGLVENEPNLREDLLGLRQRISSVTSAQNHESSSPGESHPQALTEPDVNVSVHPALIVQPPA